MGNWPRKRSEAGLPPEEQRSRWRTPNPGDDDFAPFDDEDDEGPDPFCDVRHLFTTVLIIMGILLVFLIIYNWVNP